MHVTERRKPTWEGYTAYDSSCSPFGRGSTTDTATRSVIARSVCGERDEQVEQRSSRAVKILWHEI